MALCLLGVPGEEDHTAGHSLTLGSTIAPEHGSGSPAFPHPTATPAICSLFPTAASTCPADPAHTLQDAHPPKVLLWPWGPAQLPHALPHPSSLPRVTAWPVSLCRHSTHLPTSGPLHGCSGRSLLVLSCPSSFSDTFSPVPCRAQHIAFSAMGSLSALLPGSPGIAVRVSACCCP